MPFLPQLSDHSAALESLVFKLNSSLKFLIVSKKNLKYTSDYTVEMTNTFKGLDLIECVKNYGQRFITLYRRNDQNHPQEKEMKK